MCREEISNRLGEILNSNGDIFQNVDDQERPIDLDSLQYISFIADVEEAFGITIPDEYLVLSNTLSFTKLLDVIECNLNEA